ncbi:MAG: hypothetical protein WC045_01030 [Patescibacteria group bacterium]
MTPPTTALLEVLQETPVTHEATGAAGQYFLPWGHGGDPVKMADPVHLVASGMRLIKTLNMTLVSVLEPVLDRFGIITVYLVIAESHVFLKVAPGKWLYSNLCTCGEENEVSQRLYREWATEWFGITDFRRPPDDLPPDQVSDRYLLIDKSKLPYRDVAHLFPKVQEGTRYNKHL